jgi:hypothetical protein
MSKRPLSCISLCDTILLIHISIWHATIHHGNNLNFLLETFTATADNVYNLSAEKVRELGGGKIMALEHVIVFF